MAGYLSRAEVAELLGVSPATVSTYVLRGTLPPPDRRFGAAPAWQRSTITRWAKARGRVLKSNGATP